MAAAPIPWRPLGTLLVARGFLSDDQLEAALDEQVVSGRRLGEILVERGVIPHSTLSLALAEQYGIHPSVESGFGTGLRVALQGPQPELQLVPEPAPLLTELAQPEPLAVTHLEERLEEHWAQLAAVQEQLAAAEQELHRLHGVYERRRAQAGRLLGRLRGQRSAHHAVLEQLALAAHDLHSVHRLHDRRSAQAGRLLARLRMRQEELATTEQELHTVTRLHDRRRAQAGRLVARLRMRHEQLAATERELHTVTRLHDRRHAQAGRLVARLRMKHEELATTEQELHTVTRLHDRRHAQAGRLLARLRVQQPARLAVVQEHLAATEHELHAVTRLHERRHAQAGRLLARLRATLPDDRDERAEAESSGHLVFLQFERGYELLERDGGPPAPDARLELTDFPDAVFVVTSVGRSPLPNDGRSCVFAQRAFD